MLARKERDAAKAAERAAAKAAREATRRVKLKVEADGPWADSRDVAAYWKKRPKDVAENIRQLIENFPDLHRPNFRLLHEDVPTNNGGTTRVSYYLMNRRGFRSLVSGFTGYKAAFWREEWLDEYERLEALAPRALPPPEREKTAEEKLSEALGIGQGLGGRLGLGRLDGLKERSHASARRWRPASISAAHCSTRMVRIVSLKIDPPLGSPRGRVCADPADAAPDWQPPAHGPGRPPPSTPPAAPLFWPWSRGRRPVSAGRGGKGWPGLRGRGWACGNDAWWPARLQGLYRLNGRAVARCLVLWGARRS